MKLTTISMSVLFLLAGSCVSQKTNDPNAERREIVSAAEVYVKANSAPGFEFSVALETVSANYARVRVDPKHPGEADSAIAYLKKQKEWVGVDIGTGFNKEDLLKQGFPPQVLR